MKWGSEHFLWLLFFACFYHSWPLFHDQAIFQYSAFALLQGQRPYVDFVLFHWPGTFLLHTLAYGLSGMNAWGLNLIDTSLNIFASLTTAQILRAWGVPFHGRLIAILTYLLAYFSQGYIQTAQREGLMLPFLILGLSPWLISICQPLSKPRLSFFLAGVSAALGLWIKPIGILLVCMSIGFCFLQKPRETLKHLKNLIWFLAGSIFLSLGIFCWLKARGSWDGFIFWAIQFNATSYATSSYGFEHTLQMFYEFIFGSSFFSSLPVIAFIVALAAALIRRALPEKRALLLCAVLLGATLLQYFWQRKGFYLHLIPFQYALSISAGFLTPKEIRNPLRILSALILAGVVLFGLIRFGLESRQPFSAEILREISPGLSKDDQVLCYGFETMEVQAGIERLSPMRFVEASHIFNYSNDDAIRIGVIRELLRAARDSKVKYYITDKWHSGTLVYTKDHSSNSELQNLIKKFFQSIHNNFIPIQAATNENVFTFRRR
jgi:hypothetical protein